MVALEIIAAPGISDPSYIRGPELGILSTCTGELRERYLIPMLSGEKRVAFAYTEPIEKKPTKAVVKGDTLDVNGFKSYVSGGHVADFLQDVVWLCQKMN